MDEDFARNNSGSLCVKCGKCQTVCPVFAVLPEEASAARGKLALAEAVEQGHLDGTSVYRDYLETCLLCGACQENCPNEVKTLSTMMAARESLASSSGTKAVKRLILKAVVGGPRLLDFAMRAGRAVKGLVFKRIPPESGVRRRIPLPLVTGDRTLPEMASEFFTDRFTGKLNTGRGERVGLFVGCMTNYFYPGAGEAMVELLRETGAEVYVPGTQACCGMPALTGGERGTARNLARRNLEAFEEYDCDVVVTGCASCGGNLKENYRELLRESGAGEDRIERFISKVLDINQYLRRPGRESAARRPAAPARCGDTGKTAVTYHHPCHLGRVQGVKEDPVSLIESLPGVEYVPLADSDRCCGMGGSFSLEHYDISRKINDQKIARIIETGAGIVATSCPACMMHIRDGLNRNGRGDIEVLHITELLQRFRDKDQEREFSGEVSREENAGAPGAHAPRRQSRMGGAAV